MDVTPFDSVTLQWPRNVFEK